VTDDLFGSVKREVPLNRIIGNASLDMVNETIQKARGHIESPALAGLKHATRVRVIARGGISEAPSPLLPSEGFAYWTKTLKARPFDHRDTIVLIVSETGGSKSTCALRLATAIDPTFSLDTRMAYGVMDLLRIYQTIEPGQVCIYDEGARGLLSTGQNSVEQQAIVSALSMLRVKGCILMVCTVSLSDMAKRVREARCTHVIRLTSRGRAIVYTKTERFSFDVSNASPVWRPNSQCPRFEFPKYEDSDPFWIHYERDIKLVNLQEWLAETIAMLGDKKQKGGKKEDATVKDLKARIATTEANVEAAEEAPAEPAQTVEIDPKMKAEAEALRAAGLSDKAVRAKLQIGWPLLHALLPRRPKHATPEAKARWHANMKIGQMKRSLNEARERAGPGGAPQPLKVERKFVRPSRRGELEE
jgi:hypothetical protein